jgi:selenoprotein W-related protein
MAEQLFDEFGQAFSIELIPGSKGVYDVTVDGELVYSKHQAGRHAEYEDVAPAVRQRLVA